MVPNNGLSSTNKPNLFQVIFRHHPRITKLSLQEQIIKDLAGEKCSDVIQGNFIIHNHPFNFNFCNKTPYIKISFFRDGKFAPLEYFCKEHAQIWLKHERWRKFGIISNSFFIGLNLYVFYSNNVIHHVLILFNFINIFSILILLTCTFLLWY